MIVESTCKGSARITRASVERGEDGGERGKDVQGFSSERSYDGSVRQVRVVGEREADVQAVSVERTCKRRAWTGHAWGEHGGDGEDVQ